MPGNIKHTAGANPQPNNFGRTTPKKQFKALKAMQKRFGSSQNANLKTWEDRNRAIKGSKLSK
nr:hypothetical protein [uncultured Mediterranean phage uvMED]